MCLPELNDVTTFWRLFHLFYLFYFHKTFIVALLRSEHLNGHEANLLPQTSGSIKAWGQMHTHFQLLYTIPYFYLQDG